jgi:hypothetical protein
MLKRQGRVGSTPAVRADCIFQRGKIMAARKRELIEPHKGDKRYVRRNKKGEFNEVVDVGRSLAADRRSKSKTIAKSGQGDKGDRPAPKKAAKAKVKVKATPKVKVKPKAKVKTKAKRR